MPTPSSKTTQSLTSTVLTQVQTTAGRFWNPLLESYVKLFKARIKGSRISRNRLIVISLLTNVDVLQITYAFYSIYFSFEGQEARTGRNQTICEGVRSFAAHMGWQATVSFMQVMINHLR